MLTGVKRLIMERYRKESTMTMETAKAARPRDAETGLEWAKEHIDVKVYLGERKALHDRHVEQRTALGARLAADQERSAMAKERESNALAEKQAQEWQAFEAGWDDRFAEFAAAIAKQAKGPAPDAAVEAARANAYALLDLLVGTITARELLLEFREVAFHDRAGESDAWAETLGVRLAAAGNTPDDVLREVTELAAEMIARHEPEGYAVARANRQWYEQNLSALESQRRLLDTELGEKLFHAMAPPPAPPQLAANVPTPEAVRP